MMGRSRARRGGRKGVDFENWEKPVEETGDADMIPNKDSSDSVSGWPPRADSQPERCGGWGSGGVLLSKLYYVPYQYQL